VATKSHSIFDPAIIVPAIGASFQEAQSPPPWSHPVMFVTEAGAAITTVLLFAGSQGTSFGFLLQITLWLWSPCSSPTFAEAMAEDAARPSDTLRKAAPKRWPAAFRQGARLVQWRQCLTATTSSS